MKQKTKKSAFNGLFDLSLEIERFVNGESSGAPLLQALYGAVMDEPIPERLLALVRKDCAERAVTRAPLRLCDATLS